MKIFYKFYLIALIIPLKSFSSFPVVNLTSPDTVSNESMQQYYERMHSMGINLENCMCIKCQNETHDFSENNNKKSFYKKLLIFSLILMFFSGVWFVVNFKRGLKCATGQIACRPQNVAIFELNLQIILSGLASILSIFSIINLAIIKKQK